MESSGAAGAGDVVSQLRQLADLRAAGALTDGEFAQAKAHLLGGGPAPGGAPPPAAAQPAPAWLVTAQQAQPARPARLDPDGWRVRVNGSAVAAGVGGLVTLLAFLAMPIATIPILGSITGSGLAGQASQPRAGALFLLWIIPLAAFLVAGFGAWQRWGAEDDPGPRRLASIWVVVLSVAAIIVYLVGAARLQALLSESGASRIGVSASGIIGGGFWIGLLGMIVAAGAGVVMLVALGPVAAARRDAQGTR